MAVVTFDDVQEITSITGAVDYTLGGAVAGFRTFGSTGMNDQDQFSYSVRDPTGGTNFESGIGRWNSAANSVTPLEITASSNANARVVWTAGTKTIFITALAKQQRLCGAFPFTSAADGLLWRWNARYSRTDLGATLYATKLYDISGNNRHSDVNNTSGPKWLDNMVNNRYPGLYFTGLKRITVSAMPAIASPFVGTIVFAIQDQQGAGPGNSHLYNWSGNPIGFGGASDCISFMFNGTLPAAHSYVAVSQADVPTGMFRLPVGGIHAYNGAASVQSYNRVEETKSPGTAATGTTNSFTIGSDSATSPSNFARFILWEMAVLSTALSAAKRAAYFDWLQAEIELRTA